MYLNFQKKWYGLLSIMVFAIILIGGLTRLTKSGLSIVEWAPITGIIPPLTQESWNNAFQAYQLSPEFKKINFGMSLSEFKFIFTMEYVHRLWGRLIGLIFFIPFIYFCIKKEWKIIKKSLIVGILILMQGFMGWFMVKSGLMNEPHVSPYRLVMHFDLALIILGVSMWKMFEVSYNTKIKFKNLHSSSIWLLVIVGLTLNYGSLIAGHKAGLMYNTFPLMEGQIIPHEFLALTPWWSNFFANGATIQWMHRVLATLCFMYITGLHLQKRGVFGLKKIQILGRALAGIITIQYMLGIFTLLYMVPVTLGSLHQIIGTSLYGVSIWYSLHLALEILKKKNEALPVNQSFLSASNSSKVKVAS